MPNISVKSEYKFDDFGKVIDKIILKIYLKHLSLLLSHDNIQQKLFFAQYTCAV